MTDSDVDIFVIGSGMVSSLQLTREHEQILETVETGYLLTPLPEVREFVSDRCESTVDLTAEYDVGGVRTDSYERMVDRVIDGAETADEPVALIVYGHPSVGVTPTTLLRDRTGSRDLTLEILPGISSLDCLYVDLDLNPLDRGVQIYEATTLLVDDISLAPLTPALLMQVGLVGTRLYSPHGSSPERFLPLKEHLLQFYPPDHEVCLARTATLPVAESEQIRFRLDDLETMADDVDATHTLYLPPVEDRSVENEKFRERSYSERHLDRVTRD